MSQTGKLSEMEGRSRPQTMAPEWRMEQPVCLIESDDKGALQVNPQAVKILEAIAQPVVVVAIVGLYRTGKSYLMNALAGQRTGFSLASTIQSHTKGIWMWCLPHPHRDGHTLVLLDTKGLGDAHKGDPKHDTWIFTLAVLLSSTLVYNSQGTIDQDAMSKLHFVFELLEHIKVKADEAKQEEEETAADTEYVSFFPSFIWTLRDFTLDLELEGRQVTEDEYLESTLILKKGRSMDVLNYNLPRQCIREYFPTRKCFVFVRPAGDRDMKQLESLPDSALQPEFLEQRRRFCQYVLRESRVKMLKGGHPVTGRMLGLLAQSYVETIMSGKVISLDEGITSIATKQNEAAVREGLALYDAQMEEQVTFPAKVAALSETHGACERAALQLFMQQSFKDEDQKYQEQLATAINEHYSAVQRRNRTASQETCWALLSQLSADVERKLSEGVYMQPGGYQEYVTDQRQVVKCFQRAPNKGVMAEQVLQQFMDSKKAEAASILRADKKLSEVEKQQAADQARLEQLEQQRKAEEERRQQLEQQRRDLERSHQENIRQMEIEKLRQKMEAALQSKLREQEKLLEQGFKEKAEMIKEEMKQLQKKTKQWEKLQQEFLERDKLLKGMEQLQKEAKEREEKKQQEFLERDKLLKEEMEQLKKEAEEQEEKKQQEFLERDKLLKEQMEQLKKEAEEQEEKLQQEFLKREKLMKEQMDRWQKEAKEREEKLQQELLERAKLLKEEMEQLQMEAKEQEEKLQQELSQKRAEEEYEERQREREEKERQRQWEERQWEREEKERQRQEKREEKERQRQEKREEKERQRQQEERQQEREEQERQRQYEECQREREQKERQLQWDENEKQRKHELEMQRLKNQRWCTVS